MRYKGHGERGAAVWEDVWAAASSAPEPLRRMAAAEERSRRFRAILERLAPGGGSLKGLRTVELGSGRGTVSLLLAARGAEVTLVDSSPAALEGARGLFSLFGLKAEFLLSRVLPLPEGLRGRFDAAMSFGLAEHFTGSERAGIIASHAEALRPGGQVFISVPNSYCPQYRAWKKLKEFAGTWEYGLEVPFTRRELLSLGDAAGLGDLGVSGAGFIDSLDKFALHGVLTRLGLDPQADTPFDGLLGYALTLSGRRAAPAAHLAPAVRRPEKSDKLYSVMSEPSYSCPSCGGGLALRQEGWRCGSCGAAWRVRDGIPFFSSREYYFADVPEPAMDRLLAETAARGWRAAAHDLLRVADPGSYKLAGDESRSDWKFLFPLGPESAVLDMGCGMGSIAFSLSRRCGRVVAMDISAKRLKYVALRAAQEKTSNIFPVFGGDSPRLPFPDASFDLVVLNGVLEWLGIFGDKDPREVQLEKLREVRRVLKPGGSVYIGIENRTGYVYFFGGKDHGGTRFTTLLPRPLASLVSRLCGKGPYRTYTYTEAGYRKLLAEAGFGRADFYAAIPSYRDVYFLAPLDDGEVMDYFFARLFQARSFRRRVLRAGSRLLLRLGLFRRLVPEIGITAVK